MKIVMDVAMAATLVAVMATAIVEEAPHEYLGVALFALMVTHIALNRRWLASVFRGRYTAVRALQVAAMAGLVACLVGMVGSSLVLSKHAFGWLPALPGASVARRVHMLCSYWLFVLAFVHAGLHVRVPRKVAAGKLRAAGVALAAVACYGAWSFVQLRMPSYLAGQIPFAIVDFEAPLALGLVRYASVGVLVACLAWCLRTALQRGARRRGQRDQR